MDYSRLFAEEDYKTIEAMIDSKHGRKTLSQYLDSFIKCKLVAIRSKRSEIINFAATCARNYISNAYEYVWVYSRVDKDLQIEMLKDSSLYMTDVKSTVLIYNCSKGELHNLARKTCKIQFDDLLSKVYVAENAVGELNEEAHAYVCAGMNDFSSCELVYNNSTGVLRAKSIKAAMRCASTDYERMWVFERSDNSEKESAYRLLRRVLWS